MVVFLGLSSDPKNLYDSWTNGLVVSVNDQNNYPISLKKGIAVKPGTMAQMVKSLYEAYLIGIVKIHISKFNSRSNFITLTIRFKS